MTRPQAYGLQSLGAVLALFLLLIVIAENQQEEALLQNEAQQVQRVRTAQRLLLVLLRLGDEHPAFCAYSR